jgi:hypothetical protein
VEYLCFSLVFFQPGGFSMVFPHDLMNSRALNGAQLGEDGAAFGGAPVRLGAKEKVEQILQEVVILRGTNMDRPYFT